jgi:regulator of protease activity HflC (stomatin/prohibitin superfamily)
MIAAIVVVLVVLLVLGLTAVGASVRVLREYERGVVFRLGRLMELRGPGLILLMPTIDRMVRVSLRTITLTVPPQEIITRDNIPARVTAVAYYRVVDPNRAINAVENFHHATLQIAQTTLRSVLGGVDLDHLLGERERLNESLQRVIDAQTEPWGIKVTTVEIKDVEIPERMQHAIARQAEAERERRAKIINAEGEAQAATRLADAADIIGRNPTTLQLRYLQTLREIGAQQNSTVVFPMPIDLIKPVLDAIGRGSGGASSGAPAEASRSGTLPLPLPLPAPAPAAENGTLEAGQSRALAPGSGSGSGASTGDGGDAAPAPVAEPAAEPVAERVAEPAAERIAEPAPPEDRSS